MANMYMSEIHQISKKDSRWEEIDNICFLSKNLYNCCLYEIRQYYFANGTFMTSKGPIFNNTSLYHSLKNTVDFRNGLATRPNKSVFIQVNDIFKSYFAALNSYTNNPHKFNSRPKLPRYKDKVNGRNVITFNKEALSFKKAGHIKLSMTGIVIRTNQSRNDIVEVRLVPTNLGHYQIEVVYKVTCQNKIISQNYVGIDLGINNLLSLSSNNPKLGSVVINGRVMKYINASYNKLVAKYKSVLPKGVFTSKRIRNITKKRNNIISDYSHKTSKMLVDHFLKNNISLVVIGKNTGWKDGVNLGSTTNQNFVYIPYNKFIFHLKYKCELEGIEVIVREESYTSKCSFLDMEDIKKHATYLGKRTKRGLFVSNKNIKINADINAALNILRKEIGNGSFNYGSDSICDFAVSPVKVTTPVSGKLLIAN